MKPESKLWQKVKKNTPNITWTRVESWASFGFPDLVGYTGNTGFFTVELKVTKSNRVALSPHQIAFHVKHPTDTFILVQAHAPRSVILCPGSFRLIVITLSHILSLLSSLNPCGPAPLRPWALRACACHTLSFACVSAKLVSYFCIKARSFPLIKERSARLI